MRYIIELFGESASKTYVPLSVNESTVERSLVLRNMNFDVFSKPTFSRMNVLPSRDSPSPGFPYWSVGMPHAPSIVRERRVAPPSLETAEMSVPPAAFSAVKLTVPSPLSTPGPPCNPYGPGKAASALGTTARATRTTRQEPSRRTITPPSTLTGVLRLSGGKRSLRHGDA